MGLGNSPQQHTVIALEARKSFAFGLQFKKVTGEAIDLTGATVRLVLAQPPFKGGEVLITKTATAVDLELGLVQFELQAVDLDLAEAEYPFDVTLVTSAGYSTPVMKGSVDLRANTDPSTAGTYTGFNPSTELAVYVENGGTVEVRVAQLDGMTLQVQGLLTNFSLNMTSEVEEAQGHAMLAQTHATNAGVSAGAAATSATAATTQATAAAASAATATTKAGQAATSAATATTKAGEATTAADEAEVSAAAAAASAAAAAGEVGSVTAAGVSYAGSAGLAATNVRDAIDELAAAAGSDAHEHDAADVTSGSFPAERLGGAAAPGDMLRHVGTTVAEWRPISDLVDELDVVQATGDITKIHGPITQAAYDALGTPDPDTLYVVVG